MTAATAPRVTREILEERWRTATLRTLRFAGEPGVGTDNSKHYYRITDAVEELVALVRGDGTRGRADDDDRMERLQERVWEFVHDEVIAYVEEDGQTEQSAVVAAIDRGIQRALDKLGDEAVSR